MIRLMQMAFSTPKRVMIAAAGAVIFSGVVAPVVVLKLSSDGGFRAHGWNIDLTLWSNMQIDRDNIGGIHTDLTAIEDGVEHKEIWLNSGQTLVFKHVPSSASTKFTVSARVHPEWNKGMGLPPLSFKVVVDGMSIPSTRTEVLVSGDRELAGRWRDLELDLSPYNGMHVDIKLVPSAADTGIWTLWRNPKISVVR